MGIFAREREREREEGKERAGVYLLFLEANCIRNKAPIPRGTELGFVPGFIQALCALFVHALFIIRRHYYDSVANIYPFS